ncbi:hypothetical protein [Streptomyces sp. NPDC101115]
MAPVHPCGPTTRAGFDRGSPIGRQALEGMGEGRPHVLDRLEAVLEEETS